MGAAGAMGRGGGRRIAVSRELWVLLGLIFGIHLGWYLILPYWAVVITRWRGLSATQAGALLATQSSAYLLASLAGGPLADRFGRRAAIVAGLVLQAAGLGLLAALPSFGGLLLAAVVTGLGSGTVGAPVKAGIAALSREQGQQSDAFSWRGVAANLGVTLGPLLGGLLVTRPVLLFGAAAAVHVVLAAAMRAALAQGPGNEIRPPTQTYGTARPQVVVAPVPPGSGRRTTPLVQALRPVLADRPYLAFSLLSAAVWALYTQLNLAVPLRAAAVLGGVRAIGLLWTFSALLVIAVQVPLMRRLQVIRPLYRLALGIALLGAGLGSFALTAGLSGLLAAVAVFTLGEMLVMPTIDALVARLAPGAALGTYFGIAAFAYGLGEAAGNGLGGVLFQRARGGAAPWLWLLFAVVGVALALATWGLGRLARFRGRPADP